MTIYVPHKKVACFCLSIYQEKHYHGKWFVNQRKKTVFIATWICDMGLPRRKQKLGANYGAISILIESQPSWKALSLSLEIQPFLASIDRASLWKHARKMSLRVSDIGLELPWQIVCATFGTQGSESKNTTKQHLASDRLVIWRIWHTTIKGHGRRVGLVISSTCRVIYHVATSFLAIFPSLHKIIAKAGGVNEFAEEVPRK